VSQDSRPEEAESSPLEQLLELFVYAPIGLVYEREDVLPKLVRRGKSQVKLAKVLGQMAAKQGQDQAGGGVGAALGLLATAVTEFGAAVGLAPPAGERSQSATVGKAAKADAAADAIEVDLAAEQPNKPAEDLDDAQRPLPIAKYDQLTARELIPLLGDLTPKQRDRVRAFEEVNRNRKTVLAKLALLSEG